MFLESPSGSLSIELSAYRAQLGPVTYRLVAGETTVLAPSPLGLELDGEEFVDLLLTEETTVAQVEDRYRLVGRTEVVVGVANERSAVLENAAGSRLTLTMRAYDDALAIRYGLDSSSGTRLMNDMTGFVFDQPGSSWIQPHDLPGYATPAYEAAYSNGVPIGHSAAVPSWNMPALFQTGSHWVLLAESGVQAGDYGAHLGAEGDLGYAIALPQPNEGLSSDPAGEPVTFPWTSAWRVIVAGSELATIVESDVITHLAAPSRIDDTSWITPGRASWSWWSEHASPRDPETLRAFIDLAADFGWEHTLIDANWNLNPPGVVENLVAYAAERRVGVFLWYNSGGPNNDVTEQPRDRMFEPATRREEMAWLASIGARGIKVDFFHSDRVEIIAKYHEIAEDAAEHRLMVNFHGSTVSRGWERTWPNIMTMEAVRGAEQYAFQPGYPEEAVWHNTVLPFTRNAVGPMDYTPVTFSDQQFPRLTTDSHELALAVVFSSPLQHLADSAASYRDRPEPERRFLAQVPAVWDEIRLVGGRPGEYAIVARRSGQRWYVGAINGPRQRSVVVPLTFLSGQADLELIADAGVSNHQVESGEDLTVAMPSGGGFVMTVDPS